MELVPSSEIVPLAEIPRLVAVIEPVPVAVTLPPVRIATLATFTEAMETGAATVMSPDEESPMRNVPAVTRSISASEIAKVSVLSEVSPSPIVREVANPVSWVGEVPEFTVPVSASF